MGIAMFLVLLTALKPTHLREVPQEDFTVRQVEKSCAEIESRVEQQDDKPV